MSYVVNGMIPWHPGYIEIDPENNDFCYFVGDTENGGNKTAEGLLYATRGIEPGKYYFINWGRVDEIVGVQDIDGVLYYFDADHKIAMGAGLIKIEEGKYIYVRSNGMLAQNQYYIPMGLELASGMYQIDDNGFIIDPVSSDKNGIHDGYYYENGKLAYAGLIEIDGAIYYIKSNGQVATGEYYVTKISAELADTYSAGDKLIFGEDGKMESVKNGIVLEDGNYYFYENNHIMYGAGVIEIEEGVYIYVRSNGQLATGEYWPAKTNGLLEIGKYDWGTDGKYYAD
jgi:glucan-binding YG repeat protein